MDPTSELMLVRSSIVVALLFLAWYFSLLFHQLYREQLLEITTKNAVTLWKAVYERACRLGDTSQSQRAAIERMRERRLQRTRGMLTFGLHFFAWCLCARQVRTGFSLSTPDIDEPTVRMILYRYPWIDYLPLFAVCLLFCSCPCLLKLRNVNIAFTAALVLMFRRIAMAPDTVSLVHAAPFIACSRFTLSVMCGNMGLVSLANAGFSFATMICYAAKSDAVTEELLFPGHARVFFWNELLLCGGLIISIFFIEHVLVSEVAASTQAQESQSLVEAKQKELLQSTALLNGMQAVTQAVCDIVVKLGDDRHVVSAGPACDAFFGQPMEGKRFADVMLAADQRRFNRVLDQATELQMPQCLPVTIQQGSTPVEAELLVADTGHHQPRYLLGVRADDIGTPPPTQRDEPCTTTGLAAGLTAGLIGLGKCAHSECSESSDGISVPTSCATMPVWMELPELLEISLNFDVLSPRLSIQSCVFTFRAEDDAGDQGSMQLPELLDWLPQRFASAFQSWVQEAANATMSGRGEEHTFGPLVLESPSEAMGVSLCAKTSQLVLSCPDSDDVDSDADQWNGSLKLREVYQMKHGRHMRGGRDRSAAERMPSIQEALLKSEMLHGQATRCN